MTAPYSFPADYLPRLSTQRYTIRARRMERERRRRSIARHFDREVEYLAKRLAPRLRYLQRHKFRDAELMVGAYVVRLTCTGIMFDDRMRLSIVATDQAAATRGGVWRWEDFEAIRAVDAFADPTRLAKMIAGRVLFGIKS